MHGVLNGCSVVCKLKVTVFDHGIHSFGLCLYVPPSAIRENFPVLGEALPVGWDS